MKQFFAFLLCIVFCARASCQSIERQLTGTTGTTFITGGSQLCFSIGETVILPSPSQTFSYPANAMLVTIGFQQPHVAQTGGLVYFNNWVSAYPNPTTGWVRLDIHGDNFQVNSVRIYNALGQEVAVKPFTLVNGSIDLRLDNLPTGVYFISVTDNVIGRTVTTRILKENK